MSQNRETNLALFIDFDNVALGARDARQRFEVKLLIQRILEKGKIIVKKAYADWHYYKEHMTALHEAAIELIEVPMPRISGKNSADIRLVVDAMDLCYSKDHIDTFVIVSGDSDFSPLVSKLRENNKRVIGVGTKNSSSHLLINNCDEFIFYDDIYRQNRKQHATVTADLPGDKRDVFAFLVATVQSLLEESRGTLYSSLIKDTMTRKRPDFNQRAYGFSTFGDLLDEARKLGLLVVERDAQAGGTWVVHGVGEGVTGEKKEQIEKASGSRSSRRRRRSGGRNGGTRGGTAGAEGVSEAADTAKDSPGTRVPAGTPTDGAVNKPTANADTKKDAADDGKPATGKAPAKSRTKKKATDRKGREKKTVTKKAATKKTPTRKSAPKKSADAKKTAKKPVTKKAASRKVAAKKTTARKTAASKAPAKKTTPKT